MDDGHAADDDILGAVAVEFAAQMEQIF